MNSFVVFLCFQLWFGSFSKDKMNLLLVISWKTKFIPGIVKRQLAGFNILETETMLFSDNVISLIVSPSRRKT